MAGSLATISVQSGPSPHDFKVWLDDVEITHLINKIELCAAEPYLVDLRVLARIKTLEEVDDGDG